MRTVTRRATPSPTVPEWTLQDRLRKARETADLTQAEIAALIGCGRRSVVSWESGEHVPARGTLVLWARATGVPESWLIGRDCGLELLAS